MAQTRENRIAELAVKRIRGELTIEEDLELLEEFRRNPGLESFLDREFSPEKQREALLILLDMDRDAIRRKFEALKAQSEKEKFQNQNNEN